MRFFRAGVIRGQYGIYAFNNSTGLTAENLTVESSSQDGIRVDNGSSVQDLGSSAITGSARYGINVNGPVVTLHDNVVAGNGNTGIYLVNPGNATVLGNDVAGNSGAGIYVSNDVSGTTAVIGAAPGQGNGNTVSGNSGDGIDAYGSVLVVGNAVTGATGPREYPVPDPGREQDGIELQGHERLCAGARRAGARSRGAHSRDLG